MISFRVFLAWAVCFGPSILTAQMHDAHWLFGWTSQPYPNGLEATHIQFNPNFSFYNDTIFASMLGSNSTYSDKNGSLLFYSNAINIYGKNGTILPNGETINPNSFNTDYSSLGYPVQQTLTFLPAPKDTQAVFLIHAAYDYVQNLGAIGTQFYFSKIEKNSNSIWHVSQKNKSIIEDTLGKPYVTAIRHGNGQDWWLIMPTMASNDYNICLLNYNGASVYRQQSLGYEYELRAWSGQSVVSPDGSKYVRYDPFNKLNIFDFDRCTGTLSNPIHIAHPFASPDSTVDGGVAISPNSRYLYLTASAWVYQYDLWAQDIAASRILVGEYDGVQAPLPTIFYQSQLGPDGKIYVKCGPSTYTMHVIHAPDSAGLDCRFENNAHYLDYIISPGSMPYFPNYRLGALDESPCDTLNTVSAHTAPKAEPFTIHPNPATESITIGLNEGYWDDSSNPLYIEITNIMGQVLKKELIPPYSSLRRIGVLDLETNIYFVRMCSGDGRVLAVKKLVVCN